MDELAENRGKESLPIDQEFATVIRDLPRAIISLERLTRSHFGAIEKNGLQDEKVYLSMLKAMENQSSLYNRFNELVNQAVMRLGLPPAPPEGHIRLFRGVRRIWDPQDNLENAFWSPSPQLAYLFGQEGDISVCDVLSTAVHHIPNGDLGDDEVQVPNPTATKEAKLIIRNRKLILPGRPVKPAINIAVKELINTDRAKKYPVIEEGRANPFH